MRKNGIAEMDCVLTCPGMLPTKLRVPASWAEPITKYLLKEINAGRPKTTVRLRRMHLAYAARSLRSAPTKITTDMLMDWMGRQDWKRETRRSYRSSLRGFFKFACATGLIDHDPAADLPAIRMESPRPRPAPDDAWLRALQTPRADVRLMLRLAGEAGLRRAEVSKVHVRDVLDGPQLYVHGKGSHDRIVPITDSLAGQLLLGAAGHTPGASDSGWLFPGECDSHLSPEWVGQLCAAALPGELTMHTLRHRFATRAYRASRNMRAVQLLLGHQSIVTTQRYLAVDDDEVRAAMMGAVA